MYVSFTSIKLLKKKKKHLSGEFSASPVPLVRELRSHKPHGVAKTNFKKRERGRSMGNKLQLKVAITKNCLKLWRA